jgi:CHAT domain-containing protein
VLHVAAHVIRDPEQDQQVLIALGLRPNGTPDYLSAAEIATWSEPVGLVTLSGCGSGSGSAPAGLGLFGMTRAWLQAGAQTVMATHWPITDDDGQLLARVYTHLARTESRMTATEVAKALQLAQKETIAQGGWRARPDYWAAFFVAGKE